jgi:hypothetical protein
LQQQHEQGQLITTITGKIRALSVEYSHQKNARVFECVEVHPPGKGSHGVR